MSSTIKCSECFVELELPEELIGQEVECPSCEVSFFAEEEQEDVYQAPVSRGRGRQVRDKETKFPVVCIVLPILVILFELAKSALLLLALFALNIIDVDGLDPEDAAIFQKVYSSLMVVLIISISVSIVGVIGCFLVLIKKNVSMIICKIYLGITLLSLSYSFIQLKYVSAMISIVIAVLISLTIIFFSSWLRLNQKKDKRSRRGTERGSSPRTRRKNVRLR